MSNVKDKRKLIEPEQFEDTRTELMPHDLNKMLEDELSKPADQVNAQRVQELLDLLAVKKPTPEEKDECWKAIQDKLARRESHPGGKRARRLAMVTVFVAACVVFLGTANAFNWSFLLKWLEPLADTFGIYSTVEQVTESPVESNAAFTVSDAEYEQQNYTALEDMPAEMKGYRIIPEWVPERFEFVQGSIYEDENMSKASLYFQSGEDNLSLIVSYFANDEDISSFTYEQTAAEQHSMSVQDQTLTYFFNDSGEIRAASKIESEAHIYIGGNITEDELARIAASIQ